MRSRRGTTRQRQPVGATKIRVVAVVTVLLITAGCATHGSGGDIDAYRSQWADAAYGGDAEAQYRLGVSYCCGLTPRYHTAIATAWLCRASIQGHSEAQYQLANIYAGRVVQQGTVNTGGRDDNVIDVFALYTMAAQKRHPEAGRLRDRFESSMQPDEIALGRQHAEQWPQQDCGSVPDRDTVAPNYERYNNQYQPNFSHW